MIEPSQPSKSIFADKSLQSLLLVNAITIIFAFVEQWSVQIVMWIYWWQSMTIGFFTIVRIRSLKKYVYRDGRKSFKGDWGKSGLSFFFFIHYGLFHLGYYGALLQAPYEAFGSKPTDADFRYIAFVVILFFCNHWYSYLYNRPKETERPNIDHITFFPYARIIPMHLTFILGYEFGHALLFFLLLKTLADGIMHVVGQRIMAKSAESQVEKR